MKFRYFLCIGAFLILPFLIISLIYLFNNYYQTKSNSNNFSDDVDISKSITKSTQDRSFLIRAAIPYWDQKNALNSLEENKDVINVISLFWYYLDASGNIRKYQAANEDTDIIKEAHKNNLKVSAVLTNLPEKGTWDSIRVEDVLKDPVKLQKHIIDIRNLLIEKDFDGITIDYESVDRSQEENFSKFIEYLSLDLHKYGKYVEVALHPKRGYSGDARYSFQNWEKLGKSADRIYIMAYEEHYNEGEAGPVASLPWVKKILDYVNTQNVPKSKLLLGIPLDGYDWNKDSDDAADGVNFENVLNLISQNKQKVNYDENYASPYLNYEKNGNRHEVWYENSRSVEEKIKLAKEYGLGGVTFWKLGGEDQDVWRVVKKYTSKTY